MKTCFKCGKEKPLSEFYPHPEMADGHLGKCKECTKKDVRENYAKKREQYSKRAQSRRQQPGHNRAPQRAGSQKYRKKHPDRVRARTIVRRCIGNGTLVPKPCEVCGALEVQAHHDDYSRPLEVRWLCFEHHHALHGQVVTLPDGTPRQRLDAN